MLLLLPGLDITARRHLDARPIGLSHFHPVIPGKGELAFGQDRSGLKRFIGRGERFGL